MIIRSGIMRNRDGVDFDRMTAHWLNIHGPLALRVAGMRGYAQNHIVERLPAQEGLLHRVDGISQLYFDDVDQMREAMDSPEQQACIEDIRGFLSHVTLIIQQQGERQSFGNPQRKLQKLLYLLAGTRGTLETLADSVRNRKAGLERGFVRFNPVISRDFAVDASVDAGGQIIDGVVEIWAPAKDISAFSATAVFAAMPGVSVVGAFHVDEHMLLTAPE